MIEKNRTMDAGREEMAGEKHEGTIWSDGNSLCLARGLGYRCMHFSKLRQCTLKIHTFHLCSFFLKRKKYVNIY